ncbi:MAG: hypothetical protein HKN32_03895 [Flavobacteriales bacterium]|nr:hypothetical protein [Flavobacteriales bacterium]
MKRSVLFSVVFFAVLGMAQAQLDSLDDRRTVIRQQGWKQHQKTSKLVISTYVERTHIGPKGGTSVGVEFRNLLSLGAFYQESDLVVNVFGEELTELPPHYEKQFYGLYFTFPVSHQNLIGFDFKIRTGISNSENFIITPSLHSTLKLARMVEIGAGVGMRSFRPTVQTSIMVKL